MLKVALTVFVIAWTLIASIWPRRDSGQIFYAVSSILAIAQFFRPELTLWCIGVFLVGLVVSIVRPSWSKP